MKKTEKTHQEKEAIIAEYLLGGITYRKLEKKCGIDFRVIHSWVTKFQGKTLRKEKPNNLANQAKQEVQRKISMSFDSGIKYYLLFLGIMQTCKFQNKSFLKFLLSGKKII